MKINQLRFFVTNFVLIVILSHRLVFSTKTPEEIVQIFKTNAIVPDIISSAPASALVVKYGDDGGGEFEVNLGNELTLAQVKSEPTVVSWEAADVSKFYLVSLIDPDTPSRLIHPFREFNHWLVGNIPGNQLQKGHSIASYIAPDPAPATGLHRYIFLVYEQPGGKIKFEESANPGDGPISRFGFGIQKFADKYNLGQPLAGNFFRTGWDSGSIMANLKDGVSALHEKLSTYASTAIDTMAGYFNTLLETMSEYYGSAKKHAANFVDKAKDKVSDFVETAKESAKETLTGLVDSAKQSFSEYSDTAKQTATEYVDTVKRTASGYIDSMNETLTDYVKAAKVSAGEYIDSAKMAAGEYIDAAKNTARKTYNDLKDKAGETLTEYLENLKNALSNFIDYAKEEASKIVNSAKEGLTTLVDKAQETIATHVESGRRAVTDYYDKAKDTTMEYIDDKMGKAAAKWKILIS